MRTFLIDDTRPVMWSEKEGLIEAWDWESSSMKAAPDLLLAVSMGMDKNFDPVLIEEVSSERFKQAVMRAKRGENAKGR